ncbi:transcriptional activator protein med [Paraliobacillus quinghaiensis]|uniref:Transcriptional activator protein med n=1 Tax=Paraliobacillus quinghaiensis TaxID=470815 RepID=A0A917TJ07_9BACI|nr:BMP family ABC transporter substrate-binding protein [Paraliobacillus quinghaiensis]GGM24979.1 transcriptional activator protein med [Paraliobacillus quinghaiensis]
MKQAIVFIFSIILFIPLLASCNTGGEINKVGMLVANSINDQTWGSKGYQGLLDIKESLDVDVFLKEEINTQLEVNRSVEEFVQRGVNIIFGHGNTYGEYFDNIRSAYPNVHFVYFNGTHQGNNLTSLHFNSNAMGFFAGMVAGKMTTTNHVGIIGAYRWQPEIEGFYEGVNYENPNAEISIKYVNSWENVSRALTIFETMNQQEVDVFFPVGDMYSSDVIKRAKQYDKYAIGFVTDQSNIGGSTVLTSTVQHVDKLYLKAANLFDQGELTGGIYTYDFQDEVISLGEFSPDVPQTYQDKIENEIDQYIETNLLPNERQD